MLLLFVSSVASQEPLTLEAAAPENAGMSATRLGRIDAMLQQAITAGDLPGAVALIARNGKIVFHKAYGHADTQGKKIMEKDAIFRHHLHGSNDALGRGEIPTG